MTEIGGGTLEVKGGGGGSTCRLNLYDGGAEIAVYGGTFKNFDPSDNQSENPRYNYVAEGYKVVAETVGEDTWYTVVPA